MKISKPQISMLIAGLIFFSGIVFAQSTGANNKKSKVTVYNFDEVDILGNVKKPEGATIKDRPETYFKRLLNLDESFIPNIIRSVEDF